MHNNNFILRRSLSVDILKAHSVDNESKQTNQNYEKSFDESINVPEKNSLDHHYEKHQAYFLHKTRKRDPTATQSSSSSSSNQSNYVRLIKYIWELCIYDVQHLGVGGDLQKGTLYRNKICCIFYFCKIEKYLDIICA